MRFPQVRKEILRTFLVLLALGLFFMRFGYVPYKEKLKTKKELYRELSEVYLNKKTLLSKQQKFSPTELKNKEEEKPYFLTLLFPKEEDAFLLQIKIAKELSKMAEKHNLQVQGVDMLSFPSGTKRLLEIPFIIKVRGKVKDVLTYLEKVEEYFYNKEKFFKISELTLYESRGQLDLTLKISVFKSEI
ncbi:MAG: hypothetical protein ABWJ99_08510 [Caldimicrobium sp.]